MILKMCGTCGKEFPKTKDYFFERTIKQKNKSGYAEYKSFKSDCKKCHGKKGNQRRVEKRCEELNCSTSEYRANWKKQYSETRTIDKSAKKELSKGQYRVYLQKLSDGIVSNVDEYRQEVFKNRHSKPWSRKFDYGGKVFLTLKERLNKSHSIRRDNLTDTYILNALGFKKGELPNEVIETKRLIIKLKREVRHGS